MMMFADSPKTGFGPSSSESKLTPAQCFQDVMQMSVELELFLWHLQGALLEAGIAHLASAHWVLLH